MKIISYHEIESYIENINLDNPPAILLTKFQSFLYKKLMQSKLNPLPATQPFRALAFILDAVYYSVILVFIFLFARNLLFIGYFHRVDEESIKLLKYKNYKGKVLLTFEESVN